MYSNDVLGLEIYENRIEIKSVLAATQQETAQALHRAVFQNTVVITRGGLRKTRGNAVGAAMIGAKLIVAFNRSSVQSDPTYDLKDGDRIFVYP